MQPARFSRIPDQYYIIDNNANTCKVKKKKALLTFFNEKEEEVEKHLKKEKLNIKNRGELKKIVEFYNTL